MKSSRSISLICLLCNFICMLVRYPGSRCNLDRWMLGGGDSYPSRTRKDNPERKPDAICLRESEVAIANGIDNPEVSYARRYAFIRFPSRIDDDL